MTLIDAIWETVMYMLMRELLPIALLLLLVTGVVLKALVIWIYNELAGQSTLAPIKAVVLRENALAPERIARATK